MSSDYQRPNAVPPRTTMTSPYRSTSGFEEGNTTRSTSVPSTTCRSASASATNSFGVVTTATSACHCNSLRYAFLLVKSGASEAVPRGGTRTEAP